MLKETFIHLWPPVIRTVYEGVGIDDPFAFLIWLYGKTQESRWLKLKNFEGFVSLLDFHKAMRVTAEKIQQFHADEALDASMKNRQWEKESEGYTE